MPSPNRQIGSKESIFSLSDDLHNILGEAMVLAKFMLPLKATAPNKGQTLPQHLWPESVLHDIHSIRAKTKALRRIVKLACTTPDNALEHLMNPETPHNNLWLRVTNPITLRTITSPPIRHLDTLTLTPVPEDEEDGNPPPVLLN